jgi:hypothetical protein
VEIPSLPTGRIVYLSTGCTEMTSIGLPDPSEDDTLLRLQHAALCQWLTEAILLMPEQERLVFTLHYYERLTTEEIKQVMDATQSTISQLHASALSRIHASLADRGNCAQIGVSTCASTIRSCPSPLVYPNSGSSVPSPSKPKGDC